jgi:predicted transport protein
MDTLAFDSATKSFVVIEYKKDKNFSVIDQGYAYLSSVLNNKADCILAYNETHRIPLKRDSIDWTQTRVIFISPTFTQYQIQSINFRDLPIELWEIKKYKNETIGLTQVQNSGSTESIKTISSKSSVIRDVGKEITVYSEEDHLLIASDKIKELYEQLKTYLVGFGDGVRIKPVKHYIAFIARTNFVDVHIQKEALKVWLNLKIGELNDIGKLARDVSKIGHFGNGQYELSLTSDTDVRYFIDLAEQSYKKNS